MTISNCGSDENGRYSGGSAGDQTGREYRLMPWYNRPWRCVLRHPDAKVRAKIAQLATEAAQNDNIGYDQSQRDTFWYELKKVNYSPKAIKTRCEADCSSSTSAIVKSVGILLGNTRLANINQSLSTYYMRSPFVSAGFQCLTESKYLTSDTYLLAGDILLKDDAHVAINVTDGGKSSGQTSPGSTSQPVTGAKGSTLKSVQTWLNSSYKANLSVDGVYGPKTKAALVRALQTELNKSGARLDVDGEFGPKTRAACRTLYQGTSGALVRVLQGGLIGFGFDTNGFDGIYGSGTKAAVTAFQRSKGIGVDGIAGPQTFNAMFK